MYISFEATWLHDVVGVYPVDRCSFLSTPRLYVAMHMVLHCPGSPAIYAKIFFAAFVFQGTNSNTNITRNRLSTTAFKFHKRMSSVIWI